MASIISNQDPDKQKELGEIKQEIDASITTLFDNNKRLFKEYAELAEEYNKKVA